MYVLVPMPALFFGGAPGSNLASSWVDAGKFLTGFSAVGSVAIPAILYHAGVSMNGVCSCARVQPQDQSLIHCRPHLRPPSISFLRRCHLSQKIVGGALVMQLVAVGVLAATLFAWDYMSEVDEGGFYSY